jgi:hypothetical protein
MTGEPDPYADMLDRRTLDWALVHGVDNAVNPAGTALRREAGRGGGYRRDRGGLVRRGRLPTEARRRWSA